MNPLCKNLLTAIKLLTLIAENSNTIEQALTLCHLDKTNNHYNRLHTIITGACRHYHIYQHWVTQRAKLRAKDKNILYLLIITIFQYHHLKRVNKSQLIYQAVEACKHLKKKSYTSLVRALLTKATQDQASFESQLDLSQSIPDWLKELNPKTPEKTLQAWLTPPSTCDVRINTQHISPEEYKQQLKTAGIDYKTTTFVETITISRKDIDRLPGLANKQVYIQDIHQQQVTKLLPKLKSGALVLDACAAPGGKAGALINQQPQIQLLAIDKNPDKQTRLKDNIQHLSPQITIACHDANCIAKWATQHFDAILLDAPCSATGTIQAHPEIKLTQSKANIQQLTQQQHQLLTNLWPYVKPGGYLIYSTCSILSIENSASIQKFIQENHESIQPNHPGEGTHSFTARDNQQGSFAYRLQKKHVHSP